MAGLGAGLNASSAAVQRTEGPSSKEWLHMKPHIHRIYIIEGETLPTVVKRMKTEYNFKATESMYPKRFKEWGAAFEKNRKNRDGRPDTNLANNATFRGPRRRQRRLRGEATKISLERRLMSKSEPTSIVTERSDSSRSQEAVVRYTRVYVAGLFDSFNWSGDWFSIRPPPGMPDNSSAWQKLADECFGAITLIRHDPTRPAPGFMTFDQINDRLLGLIRFNDLAMMVKFWRICLSLHSACQQSRDFRLLGSFLRYIGNLANIFYHDSHPIPTILKALFRMNGDEVVVALKMGYLVAINSMEAHLGERNAVVLHMWSNYLKTCDNTALPIRTLTARYQDILNEAERIFGPNAVETIEVLHKYLYAAFYNAKDHNLALSLATVLLNRAKGLPCLRDSPWWCLPTQGYALAAKILALSSAEVGQKALASEYLREAIFRLARGDRECQTRALMLADILWDWLVRWNELDEADRLRSWQASLDLKGQ